MGAGGVKVTVASLEMKVFEGLMKTGGGVFAKCFLGEALSQGVVETTQMLEAAGTFEAFKIGGTFGGVTGRMKVEVLEKSAAGFHFDESAFDSVLDPGFIFDCMAGSSVFGLLKEVVQGRKEVLVQTGFGVVYLAPPDLPTSTLSLFFRRFSVDFNID